MPNPARHSADLPFMVILMLIALLLSMAAALSFGPSRLPVCTVWEAVFGKMTDTNLGGISPAQEHIVFWLRFPRVLLAAIAGAGLAAAGVALQAAVRNPMADPYILGVSPGASAGAVLLLTAGLEQGAGQTGLAAAAFTGGMLAFAAAGLLAWQNGRLASERIILAGVAVSYLCTSLASYLILGSSEHVPSQAILYWLMGSVAGARWDQLALPALLTAGCVAYLLALARDLNVISIGDESAAALGVHPTRLRLKLICLAALLTGVLVAVSGGVGFVALMTPHAARLVTGSDHRRLLPLSALAGALFLVWADLAARLLIQPAELPLTIVTAFTGTPFFLWLLRRRGYGIGEEGA